MSGVSSPKVVVVTGAGSGIGKATAIAYARRGATVVCVDINDVAAKQTASTCGDGSVAANCDVGDYEAVAALADQVEAEQGPVDVLVNNAGVGVGGDFLQNTPQDWAWIRSVNLDGVVHGCHAFGRYMVERRHGHVVNVSSGAGYLPSRRLSTYCTTKAGVVMLSQCLRSDWARHGVGVSVICPGVINTPILDATRLRGVSSDERGWFAWGFKHGHSPELVANAIVRAAAKNRGVVPVGLESHAIYHVMRMLPGPVRELVGRL